ncbi:MAG: LLM class flavin-dependent oxidoreductase [Blastocatellia bacterium]
MNYGFVLDGGDIPLLPEIAAEAEAAGWDGLFIADGIAIASEKYPDFPWFDPWAVLAAMAMRTERIRLGTMITPVSRRRPWKLARETVTIDHLSNGRLIFGVGLGAAADDGGFFKVGEAMDLRVRAELLDEGLEIMSGLWKGKPLTFSGAHYKVQKMSMLPTPVQKPRIPVWVVGVWPREKSMQRVLRWDGIIPQKYKATPMDRATPSDVLAVKTYIEKHRRKKTPFDIIAGGQTSGGQRKRALEVVRPFEEAGATWWLESVWDAMDKVRKRIKQGPPGAD